MDVDLADPNEPLCRLAELNVRRQVHNLVNSPPITQAWKEGRPITVHGVMFRIETGLLEVTSPDPDVHCIPRPTT